MLRGGLPFRMCNKVHVSPHLCGRAFDSPFDQMSVITVQIINTYFKRGRSVCWAHAGTDRNITYFDAYDGQPIRIMEGSSDSIESVAVDPEGACIASGGADRTIRLWGYDEGHCYAVGTGHSNEVTKVAITPRDPQHQPKVVSVGTDGSVMVWDFVAPVSLENSRDSLAPGASLEL